MVLLKIVKWAPVSWRKEPCNVQQWGESDAALCSLGTGEGVRGRSDVATLEKNGSSYTAPLGQGAAPLGAKNLCPDKSHVCMYNIQTLECLCEGGYCAHHSWAAWVWSCCRFIKVQWVRAHKDNGNRFLKIYLLSSTWNAGSLFHTHTCPLYLLV